MKRFLTMLLLASSLAQSGYAMQPEEQLVPTEVHANNAAMRDELNELLFASIGEDQFISIVKFDQGEYHGYESRCGTKSDLIKMLLYQYANIHDIKEAGWCVFNTPQYEYQHKQANLRPKLCRAFQSWDYVKADQLFDEGADINTRVIGNSTPLMIAAHRGNGEVCKNLLKRNPNINATDEEGRTALMIAADKTRCEGVCESIVKAMLKPTKDQKDAAVAFLGCRKKEGLLKKWGVPRDIMQMIGKRVINEANKAKTLVEIIKIKDVGIKQRLVGKYIHQ